MKKNAVILAGVVLLAAGIYIAASYFLFRMGFPLDDAWIHQTYARSLAQTGRWEYFAGQVSSGGSTSPLWSVLLAGGYILRFNPTIWAFGLGAAFLWGSAVLAEETTRKLVEGYHPAVPVVGILVASEWHLVWAAVSGMETSFFIFGISLFFWLILDNHRSSSLPGLVAGLLVWVRPDGSTLLIPLVFTLLMNGASNKERIDKLAKSLAGFVLLVIPYLWFNFATAGSFFPNTFYAKQSEYAALQSIPLAQRFADVSTQPLTGVGIFVLPAALYWVYKTVRAKEWGSLAALLWALAFLGSYAVRLPVSYQHGRYEMPVIPILLLLGGLGGALWMTARMEQSGPRLVRTAWILTSALIAVLFFGLGAWSYANDTAFIEGNMVDTSKWVADNIPAGELIAAHDIGALGYFGGHPLVDLAGLISPEVIPFINDQAKLAGYLTGKKVAYLVTFPNWYPELTANKKAIFSSNAGLTGTYGGENMAVYAWK